MRVAVISTPRAGNSWLRCLLAHHCGLDWLAVHTPDDLPTEPAERLVVQLHWPRTPDLVDYLTVHDFQVVTLARHPLDVIVSILHFARREQSTDRWLDLEATATIRGVTPTSVDFEEFALGDDIRRLLDVTCDWWNDPTVINVEYAALLADTSGHVGWLAGALGHDLTLTEPAKEACSFKWAHGQENRHGWHGIEGLWRRLIPAALAWRIAATHHEVFTTLGYQVDPDLTLTSEQAEANWEELSR